MSDNKESEFDDSELVLVEGETLELRMQYLKWCDLAYARLMASWRDLAICLLSITVLIVIVCVGTMLMIIHPWHTPFNTVGFVCVMAGGIGTGGPIGRSIRLLLNIGRDNLMFASYMHSARENVVMRRVTTQN